MAETNPFGFTFTDPQAADDEAGEVTLPDDMKPEIRAAYRELQEAASRLLRGQPKAAVARACDAVNRIACEEEIHGYATY